MNSSQVVIVVAPGCPAEIIQELLSAPILPAAAEFVVLLPPGNPRQYNHLSGRQIFSGRTQYLPSPGTSFFSIRHLKWLREKLRPSENIKVLIFKSPFKDVKTALVSLLVMFLSGKTITLLFATPEAAIDLDGRGFSERWISQDLNLEILVEEMHKHFLFLTPWDILYFLMFFGLTIRQIVSESLSLLSRRS